MAETEAAEKPQNPKKPEKQPKLAPTSQTMREYETIYLLRQDLTPDQVDRIKERLRAVVDRHDGQVIRFTTWGRKKTAFLVGDKELRAIYVHLAYLSKGDLVAELERNLRNLEEVLKYQTIKVSDAVDPATRPTEEDVVLEGDREEERSTREGEDDRPRDRDDRRRDRDDDDRPRRESAAKADDEDEEEETSDEDSDEEASE